MTTIPRPEKPENAFWAGTFLLMTATRIVTHCLAVWHIHTGTLCQADKDFFDCHVPSYEETEEFVAALELVKLRLERDGLSPQQATTRAQQLLMPYAQRWGVELPVLVAVD